MHESCKFQILSFLKMSLLSSHTGLMKFQHECIVRLSSQNVEGLAQFLWSFWCCCWEVRLHLDSQPFVRPSYFLSGRCQALFCVPGILKCPDCLVGLCLFWLVLGKFPSIERQLFQFSESFLNFFFNDFFPSIFSVFAFWKICNGLLLELLS